MKLVVLHKSNLQTWMYCMKNAIYLLSGLTVIAVQSCRHKEKDSVLDQRDKHIGKYACEVTVRNFRTDQVFRSYLDTLVLAKSGTKEMRISSQKVQLPLLQVLQANAYYGFLTALRFENGGLILTSGPDSTFYEYSGRKIEF